MLKRFLLAFAVVVNILSPTSTNAVDDFSCLNFKVLNEKGLWSLSEGPEVTTAVVTWSVEDPGNCVIGNLTGAWINGDQVEINWTSVNYIRGKFYGKLSSARSGQNYVVIMKFEIPNTWISSVANTPGTWGGIEMSHQRYFQLGGGGGLWTSLTLEAKASSSQKQSKTLKAELAAATLWGLLLSNRQNLVRDDDCIPESTKFRGESSVTSEIKVMRAGQRPKISIEISEPTNCVFLIHTPTIGAAKQNNLLNPFWSSKGTAYWSNLVSTKSDLIQVSTKVFGENRNRSIWPEGFQIISDAMPVASTSSLSLVNNKILINSEIDLTQLNKSSINRTSEAQIVIGVYARINAISSCTGSPGGWRVTWVSANSFSIRYSRVGCTPEGIFDEYQVASVKIPLIDLLEDPASREKAKQEADAQAAAELKVQQEVEAKAAAELKAKQEAEAKARAESEASEAAAKSAAKAAATKKTTITCVKGKLIKKVRAVKPKCPSGYRAK